MNASLIPENATQAQRQTKRVKLPRPSVAFLTPAALAPRKEQVWALYHGVVEHRRADFEADFDKADLYAVFLVKGQVVGVATVMEAVLEVEGRKMFTIGLGRAVVQPAYRNQFLVQRALIFRWWRAFWRRPLRPIYIWGSCLSYKSYLSFVKVLRVVYPVIQGPTPPRHQAVIDLLGRHWYGEDYLPERGVVRVQDARIVDEAAIPSLQDLSDPDIHYYSTCIPDDPTAAYGLLTISPCIRSNFLPMVFSWIRNFVRKALGRKKGKANAPAR